MPTSTLGAWPTSTSKRVRWSTSQKCRTCSPPWSPISMQAKCAALMHRPPGKLQGSQQAMPLCRPWSWRTWTTQALPRFRSGSNKRAHKKPRTDSPAPVPRRNQQQSSDRGRPRNSSKDHKAGRPQGRQARSPQGKRGQDRHDTSKRLPTHRRQDTSRDSRQPPRQANLGRPRNLSSNRRGPTQELSEGAKNFLAAIQELGTQFQNWTQIWQFVALPGFFLITFHTFYESITYPCVTTTFVVPDNKQLWHWKLDHIKDIFL